MCQLNALNMCKSTLHHNQEWSHQEPREVVRNSSPKSFCRHRRLRFSQTYALRHTAWPLHHVFHIVTLRDNMSHHKCAAGGWNSTASRIDVVNLFKCPVATKTNSQTQKPSSPRPTWRVKMKTHRISSTLLLCFGCHPPHHNKITSETNNHSRYHRTRAFTVVTLDCSE